MGSLEASQAVFLERTDCSWSNYTNADYFVTTGDGVAGGVPNRDARLSRQPLPVPLTPRVAYEKAIARPSRTLRTRHLPYMAQGLNPLRGYGVEG